MDPAESAQELLNKAVTLEHRGEFGPAEQRYREAMLADPGLSKASYNLGRMLLERGRYADAAEAFRHSLAALDHAVAGRLLAKALLLAGDADGALVELGRWEEPKRDLARMRAYCEVVRGGFAEAVELLEGEGELDESHEVRAVLAYALWHADRHDEAMELVPTLHHPVRHHWKAIAALEPAVLIGAVLGDPPARQAAGW